MEKKLRNKKRLNFSNQINEIINKISFIPYNASVLGSASIRSNLYTSDYDCYEIVTMKNSTSIINRFKRMVEDLLKDDEIFISDIKCGEVKTWRIIDDKAMFIDNKVVGYSYMESKREVENLYKKNIIDNKEYNLYIKLLKPNPTIEEWYEIRKEIRPNIIRWKPKELIRGWKIIRGNKKYYLEQGVASEVITKLDIITYVNNRYTEFSNIYEFRVVDSKGKRVKKLNDFNMNPLLSMKQDVITYTALGNYFKALKRLYAFYVYKYEYRGKNRDNLKIIEQLSEILNSDLGIIYTIIGDIDVIILLIEENEGDINKIKSVIDNFINRLSGIFSSDEYISQEKSILSKIRGILESNNLNKIKNDLEILNERIKKILNNDTKELMQEYNIL